MLKYSSTKVLKMKPGGPYTPPAPFPGSSPTRILLCSLGFGSEKTKVRYIGKPFSRLLDILYLNDYVFRYSLFEFDRKHIVFSTTSQKVGPLFGLYHPSVVSVFNNGYRRDRFEAYVATNVLQRVSGLPFPFFLHPKEVTTAHIGHYSQILKGRVAEIDSHIKARKEFDAARSALRALERAKKVAAEVAQPPQPLVGGM